MNERDYWTTEAMEKFGGSFVQALAECARRAEPVNMQKIKWAFEDYWMEYQRMGIDLEKTSTV